MNACKMSAEDSEKTKDIWITVENNEQNLSDRLKKIPAGNVSLILEKFSKMTQKKSPGMKLR